MFNLEQSIADWRRQMLAAGIKAPVPLEELETHLREEIERQLKLGTHAEPAFETAVRMVGPASALKSEFKKIHGPPLANRILSLLWFAGCLWSLNSTCRQLAPEQFLQNRQIFIISSLASLLYGAGVIGSFLLFRGARFGASIIRTIALLLFIACVAQVSLGFGASVTWRLWCGSCAIFSAVSIWQLHRPKNLQSAF